MDQTPGQARARGPLAGRYVAVCGPGDGVPAAAGAVAEPADRDDAYAVAAALAADGAVLVTGGLGGVMRAAAAGAGSVGGLAVGLLPGADRAAGSAEHAVRIPTGLGELRNGLIVRAADCVVAVGGGWGTLSEVALALKTGVPVVRLRGRQVEGLDEATATVGTAEEAVAAVRAILTGDRPGPRP